MNYKVPVEDRLWPKVQVTGFCWEWLGSLSEAGYGNFHLDGRTQLAHRVVYEILVSKIPEGLVLDHLCRNPKCVNPDHLEVVTQGTNLTRGLQSALKQACPQGHSWGIPRNVKTLKTGSRYCAECARVRRMKNYYKGRG